MRESAAIADLLDKRIVVVTGKGGVGKTTVALALGIAAAARGRRALVCEIAAQENVARIFGREEIGFNETKLRERLWAISIDPDRAMQEYLELQLPLRAMGDLLYRSRIFTYLAAATPGLREMVTIGKVWELALQQRKSARARPYDLVIVDAPATGHGIGFLETPRVFAEIARVGPMHRQARTIERTLANHRRTGVAIVALPEEMPVNEAAGLATELSDRLGLAVDRLYMNGLYPQRFDAADAETIAAALADAEGDVAVALRAALDQRRRSLAQREQLERLRRASGREVADLPYEFAPSIGVGELERLAGELP